MTNSRLMVWLILAALVIVVLYVMFRAAAPPLLSPAGR
jgi:hypothetical protein